MYKKFNLTALLALMSAALMLPALVGCGTSGTPGIGGAPSTSGGAPTATASTSVGKKVQTDGGSYTNLTPAELKTMLDNKDFFLVDTHTPPEGRLPKTDVRIRFDQVEQQISQFPADKNAKIVLSCRSGRMSSEASATLVKLGYTNVYNLEGGMNAWKSVGYEIIPEGK